MTAHLRLGASSERTNSSVVALHRQPGGGRDIRQMGEELTARPNRSATEPAPDRAVARRTALAVHARGTAALIHTSCPRRRRRRCQPEVED